MVKGKWRTQCDYYVRKGQLQAPLEANTMSTPSNRLILEYQDISNGFLRSSNWINPTGSLAALSAAIQAATNSNLFFGTEAQPLVGTATPSDALYPSVYDGCLFILPTIGSVTFQFYLPSPKATIFGPGGSIINTGDPTLIALVAALTANLTDVNGNTVSGQVVGVRTSRRSEQIS